MDVGWASAFEVWLKGLTLKLERAYAPPAMHAGGHDITHVRRLISLEPRIREKTGLEFDHEEFVAAVWLHNLDRAPMFRDDIETRGRAWAQKCSECLPDTDGPIHDEEDIKAFVKVRGLEIFCRELLEWNGFNEDARDRIVDTVMHHSKFADDPDDSSLLAALRIADKVDRMGPLGLMASASFRGSYVSPYDEEYPFGYGSTEEGRMKTLYDDLFRIMEWYGMLPSDKAREVVNKEYFSLFIMYVRMLGREIAERTGTEDNVLADIKRALGPHYQETINDLRITLAAWARG